MIGNVISKGDILNFLSNKKALSAKLLRKYPSKAQSAMEYLMTYGWAILIIAVVLGALFQLGVFSPMTFAPKAPPGACQVFRPNGPGTTQFINLEGVCSGEMPQYVAQFNGYPSPGISKISDQSFPSGSNPVSIFAWIKTTQNSDYPFVFNYGAYGTNEEDWILGVYGGQTCSDSWGDHRCVGPLVNNGNWNFIGFTYAGGTNTIVYVNGVSYTGVGSGTPNVQVGGTTIANIGGGYNSNFTGSIANVQIYNTSLSANEIQALYLEGIGGAPIRLQNLVAWYPLDGDANDYSGNGNNGVPTNVIFVSNWYSGYMQP